MALVTYLPRLLPVWILSSKSLPRPVVAWLRHVPVAVLSAMLFPALLVRSDQADLTSGNIFLWAAIPTLLAAWKTRSLFGSVIVGMVMVAAARLAFGS